MCALRKLTIGMILLGLVSFAKSNLPAQNPKAPEVFPLSEGTSWVYQGTVRWFDFNSVKAAKTRVTWTTQIKTVTQRQHLTAVVINGFPSDLDWSDGHLQPNDSLLLASDDGRYYVRQFEDVKNGAKRLADSSDSLQDLIDPDDLFLQSPLEKGKKFSCDSDAVARDDNMYCWVVSSVDRISLLKVKGLEPKQYQVYEVSFRTNPDDTEFQFSPGVGLISYQYHHHGSLADTELKLVAFHDGAAGK